MFTSIRLIPAHCTLAALAPGVLGLALALGACADSPGGGGPCPSPGSNGSVTFTFRSGSFTAACFSATSDGGTVTFTSLPPAAGQTAAVMQLDLKARDALRNVCPWYPGAGASLSSSCVAMSVQAQNGASVLEHAEGGASAGLPAPAGAVSVSDWGTGPGQLVSVLFTAGSAITTGGQNPDGGTPVPVSGSATTLIAQ